MILARLCVLSASLQLVSAALWYRNVKSVTHFEASAFAGATTSAIFPPPNATNTGSAIDAFFPTDVGFPGPTPSECCPPL